jgi:tetratricopeptide (TPR) repeat protein
MYPLTPWLCIVLLTGSALSADVPFVFDKATPDVSGYTADGIKEISTASSDLTDVPQAATPSNDEILEFPIAGGGGAPWEKTETKVDELNRTINTKVEPDNDVVYRLAHQLAAEHPGDYTIDQVDETYSYLKYGNDSTRAWSYSRDTRGVDKFNSASESLSLGGQASSKCVGSGDCDDFAILIASLVESIGGTTRVIFARNNSTGGHAYSEVYLGRLNSSDSRVEEIISWLKQNYDTDKIFTHIDTDTKDVWLNLDWGPDEKGNAHPGGPFFKGDKHYIINVRDNYAKALMNPPEKSNRPPKLLSLNPDKTSPQEIGTDITWTAEAKDIENDEMQYRFFLNSDPVTKWQKDCKWIWKPTDFDKGENQVEVRVRDGKHSGPNGYDCNEAASFIIDKLKPVPAPVAAEEASNQPPSLTSLTPDKPSPQEAGTIITWTALASDPENDQIYYRFFLNGDPVTKWSTDNKWVWTNRNISVVTDEYIIQPSSSGLDYINFTLEAELTTIEVRVRDGKHAGSDSFDANSSAFYEMVPESVPSNINLIIKYNEAKSLDEQQRYKEAIDVYDQAIKLDPEFAKAWIGKGLDLNMLNNYDDAIDCLNKAIELDPHDIDAWRWKGTVLRNAGKYGEAIVAYNKAIEIDPEDADVWSRKGGALSALGKNDEAITAYDNAISASTKHSSAIRPLDYGARKVSQCNKPDLLLKQGRFSEAVDECDKCYELIHYDATLMIKGKALFGLGRFDEAIQNYDKVIDDYSKEDSANNFDSFWLSQAWYNKGIVLQKQDRNSDAEAAFSKAEELGHTYSQYDLS